MTIRSKIETLIEYAKFGVEATKWAMGETNLNVELPRSVTFLSNSYTDLWGKVESISSKYEVDMAERLFYQNKMIKRAILPNAKAIGELCFHSAINLIEYDITNVEELKSWAFAGTDSLTELIAPNATTIGDYFIQYSGIKKVVLPKLEAIGGLQFKQAVNLEEAYCESVTTITTALSDCTKLKKVVVGQLRSLPSNTFENNLDLEYLGVAKGTTASITLTKNTKVTQECLHQICENYADLSITGQTVTLNVGSENLAKIDDEHRAMLEDKNINFK